MSGAGKERKSIDSLLNICIRLVCETVAVALLFYGLLFLMESAFAGWNLPGRACGKIQLAVLASLLLFVGIVPATGKYRRVCMVVLEIGYPVAAVWFAFSHREKLLASGRMLFRAFLPYWNKQFHTNYVGAPKEAMPYTYMLAFLVAVAVLLSVMLRYVTGVRIFLLFPDLAVLSVALLVNTKPGWQGLALFFVGTVLVYAGPWSRMDVYAGDRYRPAWGALLSFCVAGAFALLIVSVSGYAFSGVAKNIPKKTPKFYAFQERVEEKVKNLTFSGITLQSTREHVDNATPKYTGKTVLTIEASKAPAGKLYLKSFASGSYRNGTWMEDGKAFAQEAQEAGYNSNRVAALLQQNSQEFVSYIHTEDSAQREAQALSYHISYEAKGLKNAYVPYFSDLTGQEGDVWTKDDTAIYKKRRMREISFVGLNENTNLRDTFDWFCMISRDTNTNLQQWYAAYVDEKYRKYATDLPVVGAFINRRMALESVGYGTYEENGTYVADQMVASGLYDVDWLENAAEENAGQIETQICINSIRQNLASQVADWLGKENTYNLYLNDIPQGEDTIAYFLETGHEGYCMHFASAGALMLQSLGVPARYASGYVVEPSAFHKEKEAYQAEVPDYNAHAWVEIYLENIGWVPVEMTPGYTNDAAKLPTVPQLRDTWKQRHEERKDVMEQNSQLPTETESQTETQTEASTKTPMETQQTQLSEKANKTGGQREGLRVVWMMCLLAAGILLALFLLIKWLRRYQKQLLKELRSRQNRRAVCRINRRIYRGLYPHRFGMKTDADYMEKLIKRYPSVAPSDWKEYMRIVQKAVFSREKITQEEAQFCYRLYRSYKNRSLFKKR